MNKIIRYTFLSVLTVLFSLSLCAQNPIIPSEINFVRQGVKRLIFDDKQSIPLAGINPAEIIGMASMHPRHDYSAKAMAISIVGDQLQFRSDEQTESSIWFGGFNPFSTYSLDLADCKGKGAVGFEFADYNKLERFIVTISFLDQNLTDANLKVIRNGKTITDESILTKIPDEKIFPAKIILQMLGSGFNLFVQTKGLPLQIGQSDFSRLLDLREKRCIRSFQSNLYLSLSKSEVFINKVASALTTGIGQADIRAITYKDGTPLLDQGRLWFTLSIRGRALPHHLQGVFSINPTVFDLKLEGIIVFDRNDGLLRNEISSHLFFDPETDEWRGLTTGFTAYANPDKEKKQILAIESKNDPRFGFSIMKARPIGMIGDIEDSHILFDTTAQKWRILTCENHKGYKAVLLESDTWDGGYKRIAGPVANNSTGTSIQKVGNRRFCFSGSSARKIFIYTYPDLQEVGTLKMDLPPWDKSAGTRVWPNVIPLPEAYPARFIALMMDRYNYEGQKGPHWSYGALYLYYGYED